MKLTCKEINALAKGLPPSALSCKMAPEEIVTELARWIVSSDMPPIPVSERLPSVGEQVLSFCDGEWYLDYYAHWDGPDKPPGFDMGANDWHPTHWLPVPPAVESEE